MKKLILGAVALAVAGFASAQVTNGKVIFNGEVYDQTCVITSGSETQTINLPKVGTNSVKAPGASDNVKTSFEILISGCNAGAVGAKGQKVRAQFNYNAANVDATSRALKNIYVGADKAENVQLRLLEGSTEAHIKLGENNYTPADSDFLDIAGKTEARIPYFVEYIKFGNEGSGADRSAVKAGMVKSEVEYSIVYQ